MRSSSSKVVGKTACGCPAAAQMMGYSARAVSIYVVIGRRWPIGATPPMANPVLFLTNSASARSRADNPCSLATFAVSTRWRPEVSTKMGLPAQAKISEEQIWPTSTVRASAASRRCARNLRESLSHRRLIILVADCGLESRSDGLILTLTRSLVYFSKPSF